jgi:hypothetical protein
VRRTEETQLVHQPEYGTNRTYIVDIINFSVKPGRVKIEEIQELYLKKGLSAAQIATKLEVSDSFVFERLRATGVRYSPSRNLNPENYLCPTPPYGYKKRSGKLLPNKTELRVCRLIVQLIDHEKLTVAAVARELTRQKIRNRKGTIEWGHSTVKRIYNRWHGKI